MNNALEALEKLTNYKCSCMSEKVECKEIIEKALKDYEKIKFEHSELKTYHYDLLKENEMLHNQNVKKLKALKIIKEKKVDIHILTTAIKLNDIYQYNARFENCAQLTQEEFDLLKEALL